MQEPVSDEVARARWLTINALRLGGVAMVIAGMLGTRQVLAAMARPFSSYGQPPAGDRTPLL